jgi:hypothetical protein
MMNMGGVNPQDQILLRNPDRNRIELELAELGGKVSMAAPVSGRTEVLFYYSGHADENGLRLGDEHLSYLALRQMMDAIDADVKITVLDACASGAITRIKGGTRRKAFLVDESSRATGYAFLTSSSADEAAQESDRIGASYFTHYLITGMRGAADMSGEGKVTLNEAYQFAFHETLATTTDTMSGAQHPAYQINLSGTGDVVMTDLRQISAGLLLSENVHGRFFIRNSDRQLIAELYKPPGRTVELGLEPGNYEIFMEQDPAVYSANFELRDGEELLLEMKHFKEETKVPTIIRGTARESEEAEEEPPSPLVLSNRSRLEFSLGYGSARPDDTYTGSDLVEISASSWNLSFGIAYIRWLQEDIAMSIEGSVLGGDAQVSTGIDADVRSIGLGSIMVGVRKYLPKSTLNTAIRPYLTGAIGTYIGSTSENSGR